MFSKIATKFIAICGLLYWATSAFSHDGHSMGGSHWHATDAWGFAVLGVLVAVALWFSRGGK